MNRRDLGLPAWFIALWVLCVLLGLAMWGLIGWAVYRVVVHYT
jgi:hypothetical protein